mmetsp:Transcript_28876/g.85495  ORF Transcript_28876/g.85495 Transcript_28876/m.85495 type:complete len:87 (+) Transcript_28876:242-502(+)
MPHRILHSPSPGHVTHSMCHPVCMQDDARDARWFDVAALPTLAFDHKLVVKEALRTLAAKPESHGDLQQSLSAAADKLEGPWQQGA